MPDTHGFEVITEVSVNFLRKLLRSSWKSSGRKTLGDPFEPGRIPEALDIPAGTAFGAFVLNDGEIKIPQDQVDLTLEANKGVKIKVGLKGHAELQNAQNPAVPSIKLQDITADVVISAPVGPLTGPGHGPNDIGVQLQPPPLTVVTLTGPDPAARLDKLMVEQFRTLAAASPVLPEKHNVDVVYRSIKAYRVSEGIRVATDAAHQVDAVRLPGTPPRLVLKIPVQFTLRIPEGTPQPPADPPPPVLQGVLVEARLVANAVLADDPGTPGGFLVKLGAASTILTVEGITPLGDPERYKGNQTRLGPEWDSIVAEHIRDRGRELLIQAGDLAISIPTVASIQNSLAKLISDEMAVVGFIPIWPPKADVGVVLTIVDAAVKVLADGMVLAINKGTSGNLAAVTDVLPLGRDLAFAISADGVTNIFETIKRTQNLFRRYEEDGDEFDLKTLTLSLKPGALHFDGSMTVIDAIACFDVDATFGVDVRLSWGSKHEIVPDPDTPDVDTDLSIVAWVVSLILGFVTFGAVGVVIAIIILKICESVAENIGANITKDPAFTSIAAWPEKLPKIGDVEAFFDNPIEIGPDGLTFSGSMAP